MLWVWEVEEHMEVVVFIEMKRQSDEWGESG
jgi:hypothetical protein